MVFISDTSSTFIAAPEDISVPFSKKSFKHHQREDGLKFYLVVTFLRKYLTSLGQAHFTLQRMLDECGYSPTARSSKVREHFVCILNHLRDNKFISYDCDLECIKGNQLLTINLLPDKNLFFTKDNFVLFTLREFNSITQSKVKSNPCILTGVFLFIKQHIYMTDDDKTTRAIAYPSKRAICKALGYSSTTTIEKAISDLILSGLLYKSPTMYIQDEEQENVYYYIRNAFSLCKDDLKINYCIGELSNFYGVNKIYLDSELPPDAIRKHKTGMKFE